MRRIITGLGIGLVTALTLGAQAPPISTGTELRSFVGAYLPTGAHQTDFKSGTMVGLQAAQEISSNLHFLASFGWTHGHNNFAAFTDDRTFIWQYDVGVEVNGVTELDNGWLFRPLMGAGLGGRTYEYKNVNVGSNSCAAGYASVGSELQRNVVALRLETRLYANCFESPLTGEKSTRNDLGISFGLVYHIR
jgi:hypothetical protein